MLFGERRVDSYRGTVSDPSESASRTGQRPVLRVSQFLPLALLNGDRIDMDEKW